MDARRTWEQNGAGGWNIGPNMDQYICYHVYINEKISEHIGDTVELFPNNTKMTFMSSENCVSLATEDLT